MEQITFFKMSGSGNDFIIVDNRSKVVAATDLEHFITRVCRRKLSVGADGFILIENAENADFSWQFFNSDGSRAEMCGNGARCAARFAFLNGIAGPDMTFGTDAGIVHARVDDDRAKVKVPDPTDLKTDYTLKFQNSSLTIASVNTGVPHVVIAVEDFDGVDVQQLGREIRYHQVFAPAGTNVNFVCPQAEGGIEIRTYERGVEGETLACGTGSIAAAIVAAYQTKIPSPVKVLTRSGEHLNIYYKEADGKFYDVHLEGDARGMKTPGNKV
jgi:diaminopimelate epimerase